MMNVLDDEFMVCVDCLMVIANSDYSGLAIDPETEDQRTKDINDGFESIDGHICCGDSERDQEFSWSDCDCCGSSLGGSRHHCVILGDEE